MKISLLFLLSSALCFASAPVVVVNSAVDVTVNGVPSGTVVDVLANDAAHPLDGLRAAMLDAWLAYEKKLTDKAASASDRLNEIVESAKTIDQDKLPDKLKEALLSDKEQQVTKLNAAKAEIETKLAAIK